MYHAECNLDYSMIRAGIAQCSVPILLFQKEEIFKVRPLKEDKSKSTQIFLEILEHKIVFLGSAHTWE